MIIRKFDRKRAIERLAALRKTRTKPLDATQPLPTWLQWLIATVAWLVACVVLFLIGWIALH